MKTVIKPTKAQLAAADEVRAYLKSKCLQPEEDETTPDGVINISVTERDSAGEDHPSDQLMADFRHYRLEIRKLTNRAFVTLDTVDEWASMGICIRKSPRIEMPTEVKNLSNLVRGHMEELLGKHDKLERVEATLGQLRISRVVVCTNIKHPYGQGYKIDLGWSLNGSSVEGWRLLVNYGSHSVESPIKVKRITLGVIVTELKRILAELPDPLDALPWIINMRLADGKWIKQRNGDKEDFDSYRVHNKGRTWCCNNKGASIVCRNRVTGELVEAKCGDEYPVRLREIKLKTS